MEAPRSLAAALLYHASRNAEVFIDRSVWGSVLEPRPQRTGVYTYSGGDYYVRVGRVGGIYGYLEARVGSCRGEGVLVYGQAGFRFRASRVEGSCEPAEAPGVEPVED